jgi:putative acetyltransferase
VSAPYVTYRPATGRDAADMVSVHHESVRGVPPGHYPETVLAAWSPVPDDQRRQWLANLIEQRDVVCEVAVLASGAAAGFCLAFPGRSRLQALYVHPAHSSRGIGAGLLRAVEARCRAAGAVTLELNASYNAAPFYRANGYVPVRETTRKLPRQGDSS